MLEALRANVPIFAGLRELLHDLQLRFKMALASGSVRSVVNRVIVGAGLELFLPVRVSGDDVSHAKPDPECFLKAAAAIQVVPDRCVVIEDSPVGIEAAHRAGMFAIAITNSLPREKLAEADFVVKNYAEIRALLLPR
jgi:HAD superfamily hydrolase (TIGR01509 family)